MSGAGSKGKNIARVDVADLAAGLGARFSSGSHTTDTQPSHTSRTADTPPSEDTPTVSTPPSDTSRTPAPATASTTRRERGPSKPAGPAGSEAAAGNIRRSLYTHTTAFAALDDAAARIADATGGLVPKHDAIARLMHAGVARTDEVIAEITQELTARLAQPAKTPRTDI